MDVKLSKSVAKFKMSDTTWLAHGHAQNSRNFVQTISLEIPDTKADTEAC